MFIKQTWLKGGYLDSLLLYFFSFHDNTLLLHLRAQNSNCFWLNIYPSCYDIVYDLTSSETELNVTKALDRA